MRRKWKKVKPLNEKHKKIRDRNMLDEVLIGRFVNMRKLW